MADSSIPFSMPGSKYFDIVRAFNEIAVNTLYKAPLVPNGKKLSDIEYYVIIGGSDAWVAGNMISSLSTTYGLRRADEYWAQTGTSNVHVALEDAATTDYLPRGRSSSNYYLIAIKWR